MAKIRTKYYCDGCGQYFPDEMELILHCHWKVMGREKVILHDISSIADPDNEPEYLEIGGKKILYPKKKKGGDKDV